jgi:phosphatidylserine/phosphatidylglycerophosphate/cardiolipin synthase-like enzyme
VTILDRVATWRIHDRAESALLIDGRDYYRAFYSAVSNATTSILLLGWQFDSDVQLVRGDDLPDGIEPQDVQLLALLDRLCRERPGLQVRVLAWDHSVFFALERELLQKLYFDVITCERFVFRWDNTVPLGGSHHQKVAIVDGRVAFFGSQDICQARWDDSSHRPENEHRTSRGICHQPYHEVQVAVTGEAARSMVDLFVWRWYGATGERLDPRSLVGRLDGTPSNLDFPVTMPMPPARLGLARTIPEVTGRKQVSEVVDLYVRAIESADRFIYVESQYLTSCAVRDAMLRRMADGSRPKLEIVVILPRTPERFKEKMTVGVPQAVLLQLLDEAAREYGHSLGIYNVLAGTQDDGEPLYVYIHAKLMIVDDRRFIVGSANLTNRSMTIDSEIVAAYEPLARDHELRNAIRRARVRLMLEHAGEHADVRDLVCPRGLVARLDRLVASGKVRMRRHDLRKDEPNVVAKAVHDLTLEFLDPWDGTNEKCFPAA